MELVKTQHAKAYKILEDNIGKLHQLAKYLYDNETITGEEFMKNFGRANAAAWSGRIENKEKKRYIFVKVCIAFFSVL